MNYKEGILDSRISRRTLLKRGAALALSSSAIAAALAACGESSEQDAPTNTPGRVSQIRNDTPANQAAQPTATEAIESTKPTAVILEPTPKTQPVNFEPKKEGPQGSEYFKSLQFGWEGFHPIDFHHLSGTATPDQMEGLSFLQFSYADQFYGPEQDGFTPKILVRAHELPKNFTTDDYAKDYFEKFHARVLTRKTPELCILMHDQREIDGVESKLLLAEVPDDPNNPGLYDSGFGYAARLFTKPYNGKNIGWKIEYLHRDVSSLTSFIEPFEMIQDTFKVSK